MTDKTNITRHCLKKSFEKNVKGKYGDVEFYVAEDGHGYDWIYEAMVEYAKIKVEQQRDLVAKHLNVRNVPKPVYFNDLSATTNTDTAEITLLKSDEYPKI